MSVNVPASRSGPAVTRGRRERVNAATDAAPGEPVNVQERAREILAAPGRQEEVATPQAEGWK
jgi:hypothetical protein